MHVHKPAANAKANWDRHKNKNEPAGAPRFATKDRCPEIDESNMRTILRNRGLHYHQVQPKRATDLEDSLLEYIRVDNLDEDNKFICTNCTKKNG